MVSRFLGIMLSLVEYITGGRLSDYRTRVPGNTGSISNEAPGLGRTPGLYSVKASISGILSVA